jgi:hypothetical protein
MTISSEVSTAGPYDGNGVTTIFPYEFRIVDEDHIRVVLRDIFGVSTDLSLVDGDYTVTGVGNDAGGNVTVVVAPATGQKLTLLRNPPFTQETDLANQGPYNAEVVEDRFDMMVMQIQTVKEITDRSIQVSPGQTPPTADLIEAAEANAEAAAASAQAAGESAQDAAESAALASEFANNPEDVAVLPGLYSAFHFMKKAQAAFTSVIAGFAAAIHAATAKSPMVDADEIGFWDSVSGDLRKITLANFVTSVFTAARTIANATFAGATFRLRNAATAFYLSTAVTALTANRTLTFPDADVDLGKMGIKHSTAVINPNTAAVTFTGVPAGVRRVAALMTNIVPSANALVAARLGSTTIQSTGYLNAISNTAGTATTNHATDTTGACLTPAVAAGPFTATIVFERIAPGSNTWLFRGQGIYGSTSGQILTAGVVTLAGDLDRVQITSLAGTALLNGTMNISWEF